MLMCGKITLFSSLPVENKENLFDKVKKDLADFIEEFRDMITNIEKIQFNVDLAMLYVTSTHYEEVIDVYESVLSTQEYAKLSDFYNKLGFQMKNITKSMDFKPIKNLPPATAEQKEKLANVIKDLYAVTDIKKIKEFQAKKLKSSAAFKEFYDIFQSDEAHDLLKNFMENPQVDKLFKFYEKYGIPMLDLYVFHAKISFFLF